VATSGHVTKMVVENLMLHSNLMALSVIEPEFWAIEVHIAGIGIFNLFCSYDLDPMTFICELDLCCLEIHRMCKYELTMLRLSKVIV